MNGTTLMTPCKLTDPHMTEHCYLIILILLFSVTPIKESELVSSLAYVLFYERVEMKKTTPIVGTSNAENMAEVPMVTTTKSIAKSQKKTEKRSNKAIGISMNDSPIKVRKNIFYHFPI